MALKTIGECRLELVAHSVMADYTSLDDPAIDLGASRPSDIKGWSLDYMPASAARVSFGNEDKTGQDPEADKKLMAYLAKHQHMTPFEHQSATFLLEVPLFIRSQIHRHRTFAYNEISRRYTQEELDYWIPDSFRKQAYNNRQASVADAFFDTDAAIDMYGKAMGFAFQTYENLLKEGVCREQARAVLPQALLTKFYMTGSLRNWAHFVALRDDDHAQYEVRVPAQRIDKALKELWPNAWGVLRGVH
jgi:thymidylate synthase (FAD)